MSFNASSTKERYEELRKNPLVFSKFGPINIQDDMGYNHSTTGWRVVFHRVCLRRVHSSL